MFTISSQSHGLTFYAKMISYVVLSLLYLTEGEIVVKIRYWYIFDDHADFRWSIDEEVVNL
jgi:hypothetical protein